MVWGFQGMSVYSMGDLGEDGYILDLSDMLEDAENDPVEEELTLF